MKLYSIFDNEFNAFGRVLDGDFSNLLLELSKTPCPVDKTIYQPTDSNLENTVLKAEWEKEVYGGMPIQIGYCNGYNDTLNALEYHKGNEINVAETDVILILGDVRDIKNGTYDTANAKSFILPARTAVEIYSTTLHYAPCCVNGKPFRVIITLPKGTNYSKPVQAKDPMLWGSNKWLIAHPDSPEAKQGALIGLKGDNIKIPQNGKY